MNAHEYLAALKQEISALPFDEQNEALAYYSDYFADAGSEREQEVMAELGSPEQLAAFIRSKIACVPIQREQNDSSHSRQNNTDKSTCKTNSEKKAAPPEKDNSKTLLLIILVLFTLPLWGSLASGALSVVSAIFLGIVGISSAGLIAAIGLLAGAVALLLKAFFWFPLRAANAVLFFGCALFLMGLACLLAVFGVWLFRKVLPAMINFIVRICKLPFNKKRNT